MQIQITKDQHVVPKMLLKHFISNVDDKFFHAEKGKLSCFYYDLVSTKIEHSKINDGLLCEWGDIIKNRKPAEVMKEIYIYEVDGLPTNTIEERYGKIETEISPILDNFLKSLNLYTNNIYISDSNLEKFIRFMYIQSVRSKSVINMLEYAENCLNGVVIDFKKNMMFDNSDLYGNCTNNFYNKIVKNYSFILYKAPKNFHFVLGETATMWLRNYKDLYMPINPNCCFALIEDGCKNQCSIEEMSEDIYFALLRGYTHNSGYLISDMFSDKLVYKVAMDRLLYTHRGQMGYLQDL